MVPLNLSQKFHLAILKDHTFYLIGTLKKLDFTQNTTSVFSVSIGSVINYVFITVEGRAVAFTLHSRIFRTVIIIF